MRRAFTLVEALVVVAIIAILLGLLLPALKGARIQSLVVQDLSNLRALMQAHSAYMNVYEERFVDVGLPHGTVADPSLSFVNKLRPFFGGSTLAYRSPLDQSPHWGPDDGGVEGIPVAEGSPPLWRRTSYGMNNYLSRTFSPLVALDGPGAATDRLSRIPQPEQTVCFLLMAETGPFASADHPHVEDWGAVPDPARKAATQCMVDALSRQRPSSESRSNYAYLDGHAATRPFGTVFRNANQNQFDPTH